MCITFIASSSSEELANAMSEAERVIMNWFEGAALKCRERTEYQNSEDKLRSSA